MRMIKLVKLPFSLALIAGLMVFSACGSEKKEARSMSAIQAEEGMPVKVQVLQKRYFHKDLGFFAKFRGIQETTEGSKIGGRVDKINYTVGTFVQKGTVIAQFPEDAVGAGYEAAKSAYENSKKNYERGKALLEAGEMSQSNFDGLETKYLVDKSTFDKQRQLIFIDAPFDGTITEIKVNEKDNVPEKTPLFTIARLNTVVAKIWATESEIKQIKKGMKAAAKSEDKEFTGIVSEVAITADPKNQAFYAEIEFANPNLELKSGVTAEIKIRVYENQQALVIRRNLIAEDENGKYVFVENNSTAVKKYVSVGLESDIDVEITNGLDAGDKLIVKGNASLTNDAKVKVIK